jgi:phosphoribosylglycinamide formyltransferase-1
MSPKIVVCASGEGTNFEAIVRASREGGLKAEIAGLISNRKGIGALGRARLLSVPQKILSPRDYALRSDWDRDMVRQLESWKADWVVLAGFLALIGPQVLARFPGRIVNSHPALLPKFGGEGMYGDRVHEAVLKAGESETGITIHTIDGEYDRGMILAQDRVTVEKGDTAATLAEKVKAREVSFYPKVLNDLVTGRIKPG